MGIVEGKVAIVTGGTRGIGFTIVREFLKNGAKVALAGSRQETVDAALAKLAEEGFTDNVMGIAPSLTDPDSVAAAFASVVDRFGRLDVLCNNAGVSSRTPLVDYTLEEFNKVMSINVTAVFVCTQAAARIMIEQGEGGSIVNTSSMVGKYGQPSGFAYPTSKFAVNGLTLSLARELAKHKIRVNAVAPGVTHTDMVDALPDSVIKPLIESIPLGRMGEPEDIACACLYLASDMSSYVSGAVLPVDGLSRPSALRRAIQNGRRPSKGGGRFHASAVPSIRTSNTARFTPRASSRRRRPAPVPSSPRWAGPRRPCARSHAPCTRCGS